jgi:putative transposase
MHFEENTVYHVYNRSYNKNRIFYKEENYFFFLNKLKTLKDLCEVFAYCLMPDHFHLLIYIPENTNATRLTAQSGLTGIQILSRKLGTILSSYTQAINKQEKRSGSLFQPKSKAKDLFNNNYSFNCFHYIHQNPLKAGLVKKIEDWTYSSFNEYYKNKEGICNKILAIEILDLPTDVGLFYKQFYLVINDSLIQNFD